LVRCFFILFNHLAGYFSLELQRFIVPHTVLEFMRNILANRLANNGSHWADIYTQYNSGTYNNQNMVCFTLHVLCSSTSDRRLQVVHSWTAAGEWHILAV
jgi:hypothetical protein